MFNKKMKNKKKNHYPFKKHVRNIVMMTIGSVVDVIGFSSFVNCNGLLAGGVWGISSLLNYFISPVPMAVFVVILNVPLLIWGWNKLNLRFAVYTVYCILLQSALLLWLQPLLPHYTGNILLACIFGGMVVGAGAGWVVRYHGSGGGSDILGIILKKRYDISVGSVGLYFNSAVVLGAGFIYGFEPAMYTIVELFVCARVFTRMLEGINRKRNMMIVSSHGKEIADKLMHEVGRGVTLMKGEGGFTHEQKDVLFCVVSRFELSALKEIIQSVDPQAFVCINETYEVMGLFPKRHAGTAYTALLSDGGDDIDD